MEQHCGYRMAVNLKSERVNDLFADPSLYLQNNPYVELRAEAVRRLLPWRHGMSVLDLGCGDGRISIPLVKDSGNLLLVDSSVGMLELARRYVPSNAEGRVRIECIDLAEFQPRQQYDIVLCIGVLAHVPNPAATLRQIADLVGPSGYALVQLTDDAYFLGRLTHRIGTLRRRFVGKSARPFNHMTLGSICTELQNAGLQLSGSYRYVYVPGFRRLPTAVTRAAVRAINGSILSLRGGEVLALFTRM
jgi:2-polyprenyl-3-methyl-5-hydroxy-6-metoxy-1,4-benzoquinol methylase